MFVTNNKSLVLLFTLFFVVILCGAVSAASTVPTCKNLSVVSSHNVSKEVSYVPVGKLIDSGVTLTKSYLVKKDSLGRYSPYGTGQAYSGMKYPTKYYWKTYLYPDGTVIVYTHFYHTTLKQTMNQRITIGKKSFFGSPKKLYYYITPKSWGNSGYQTVYSTWGTPIQFYWHPAYNQHSIRYLMIKYAVLA